MQLTTRISPRWLIKLQELWQYAVFRWCVYQTSLLVFGLLLKGGVLSDFGTPPRVVPEDLSNFGSLIWILIFTLPAVQVWRKPIWKLVKQAIRFLNKQAEG